MVSRTFITSVLEYLCEFEEDSLKIWAILVYPTVCVPPPRITSIKSGKNELKG